MALIKMSAIGITRISGTTDGQTFAFNRGGKYVRNWAKPTNPKTDKQTFMRQTFGWVSQLWGTLSVRQVEAWNTVAKTHQRVNRLGEEYSMNGFSYFQSVNFNNLHAGLAVTKTPPAKDFVIPSLNLSVINISGDDNIAISPENTDGLENGANYVYSVSAYAVPEGKNQGFGTAKPKYRTLYRQEAKAVDDYETQKAINATWLDEVPAGSTVYLQVHVHTAAGQKSESQTFRIIKP